MIPVDLVIDHSVQVDEFGTADALAKNVEIEFERNQERYEFLKWGQKAFDNFNKTGNVGASPEERKKYLDLLQKLMAQRAKEKAKRAQSEASKGDDKRN